MSRIPARRLSALTLVATTILIISAFAAARGPEQLTPVLLTVQDAPVPFTGSDARTHLVYELWVTNFSNSDAIIERVQILGDGTVLQDLDSAEIATRLQPAGLRVSTGTLAKGVQALLYLHIALAPGAKISRQIIHRVTAHIAAAPPDHQEITADGAPTVPDRRAVAHLSPPLLGERYLSADSCCDATRHTRAALPVNGRVWVAQRFAVDWEQLDASGRIYSGAREDLASYAIFGKPALAVADAIVESVTDRYQEQTPGKYPINISLEEADGNSVILDLGDHRYALYAHLQPGSIKVHRGERVTPGQVLGLVGNTGNSVAPHLHFHVMDGPSPLSSNGLPYEIDNFRIIAKSPGTEPFDQAEANGTPLAITPISPEQSVRGGLPLDQLVISFFR
jgi:hypothetical protein